MGRRLLPRNLPELYAYAIAIEREAAERFKELEQFMRDTGVDHIAEEFEKIGREEREQYEALSVGTCGQDLPKMSGWEYAWHYLGPDADRKQQPRSTREALTQALCLEHRTQGFYIDVAESSPDESVRAFAAEMAVDEQRHIVRLETLLAREPMPAAVQDELELSSEKSAGS
jgi:rubrerythrin